MKLLCSRSVGDSLCTIHRVLRATQESRILVNFCGALFGLYFVTMLAYGEDMPEGACRLWAFLMDYFFIVALIWTFAEALLVFLRQKMPSFDDRFLTRNLSWIFLPIAWGKQLKCLHYMKNVHHVFFSWRCAHCSSSNFTCWAWLLWRI